MNKFNNYPLGKFEFLALFRNTIDSSQKVAILGLMTSCLDLLCSWPSCSSWQCARSQLQFQSPDPTGALQETLEIPSGSVTEEQLRRSTRGEVSAGLELEGGLALWFHRILREGLGSCKLKFRDL